MKGSTDLCCFKSWLHLADFDVNLKDLMIDAERVSEDYLGLSVVSAIGTKQGVVRDSGK